MRESHAVTDASGLPPNVRATVITVGTFDGVHLGHRDVLARLAARSRETGLASVLVTFEPHPLEVVNPTAAPPLLTVGEEKLELLAESGINYVIVVPFTTALSRHGPEQFIDVVLRGRGRMSELLIGYDHGFGRGREGDVEVLHSLGARRGFRVEVVPPFTVGDGRPVSSTSIRRAVAGGDLHRAAAALGRLYSVGGRVRQGDQRGRLLGFPTINLPLPSPRKLLPPEGVYAVRVQTPAGPYGGMMNLGPRPTFADLSVALEVHLFDARVSLYGAHVRIEFVSRLRDTMRFPDADALIVQLRRDEDAARRALTLLRDSPNVPSSPTTLTSAP
jgi:riboflavin kinase/FMN adenylyltransferase